MQSHAAAEPAIRPKVMRRPAHFAGEQGAVIPHPAESAPVSLPALYQPPKRYWQDDASFGLALIGIVVTVNVLLILGLPLLQAHGTNSLAAAATEHAAPATHEAPRGAVTIYTQPGDTLGTPANLAPLLSSSAMEMPVPRARPLGGIEE